MSMVEASFRAVVDSSWRSSCLIVTVFVLRTLLHGRLPARIAFWVWIAVAIRLLLPVDVPVAWSPFNLVAFAHRDRAEIAGVSVAGSSKILVSEAPALGATAGTFSGKRVSPWMNLTPGQWIAMVWAAGVVALALGRLWAYARFVRALRRSRPTPAAAMASLMADAAPLAFNRITVWETDAVSAPALHGIFRPQLLLPRGFAGKLTPRELRLIIAHELAHDQRRDLLAQVLIRAAVILHWFNPLVWIVARFARNDCELACDESVLRRLTAPEREHYGVTLLKIITLANCGTPPPLGLGVVESKQQIKRRIQMIVDQPSASFARTLLGCALFALVTGLSLTRESHAQPQPAVSEQAVSTRVPRVLPSDNSPPRFAYDASTDGLDALFNNGVVAVVGDRVIMVADVRRELTPLLPQLERTARDQDEFTLKVRVLQNNIVSELIERVLLIKQFHLHKDATDEKHIPPEYVDTSIAETIEGHFDNDRGKFLADLRNRGVTMSDYRRQVEDDIIYYYMKGQERQLKAGPKSTPAKTGPQVHLRMIELTRAAGETDDALLVKANVILGRFRGGEAFAALAREFDEDKHRDKGGDWSWRSPTDLKSDYSDILFALKTGEVSEPLLLKEGCFLLYAEERK